MRTKPIPIEMKQNTPTSGKTKPAARKPAARKPAARKPAAKKPAAKKPAARKPAAKKSAAKKPAAKKPAAKKSAPLSLNFDWDRKSQIKHMLSLPKEDQTPEETEVLKQAFERGTKDITSNIITMESPVTKTEIDLALYYKLSQTTLGNYVTLDWQYIEEIRQLKDAITKYAKDTSQSRPLNIMMQAEPGSGKSYFIKCLAKSMKDQNIEAVDFNMTTFENIDDFTRSLDAVRNIKVNDKLPLLFLDEFDCSDRNFPILLPLLWDGELQVGQRDLKVGKVIIVLAGSGKNIEDVMKSAKAMHEDIRNNTSKLADLMSRINGGELSIPNLDAVNNNRDRRVDKVCIAIALLQNRFGGDIETVPWCLLSFISQTRFRYGVRSISHLIDLINLTAKKEETLEHSELNLPLNEVCELKNSSLAYHLIAKDGPASVIDRWRKLYSIDVAVRIQKAPDKEPPIIHVLKRLLQDRKSRIRASK